MSKSGTIQVSIAAILGIAVVVWLHTSFFYKPVMADSPMDSMLEHKNTSGDLMGQTIKLINSSCPKQLDSETQLDSASYLPGNVFAEYFTLVNMEMKSIDTASIKPSVQESILNNIKGNAGYATFRSNNVTFAFIYRDKLKEQVFTISITPDKYNN